MSFLKRLLGLRGEREEERPFVDRSPRIQLLPLHDIRFELTSPEQVSTIQIANVSSSGIGFLRSSWNDWPAPASTLEGWVQTLSEGHNERLDITVRIARISTSVVGCSLLEPLLAWGSLVSRYFDQELAAVTMIAVDPAKLQAESDGQPHGLYGAHNTDRYFVTRPGDPNHIVRFNLTFLGNYVEGGNALPTKYGKVEEAPLRETPTYKASSLIRWNVSPDYQLVASATRFVRSIPHLSFDQKEEFARLLEKERAVPAP